MPHATVAHATVAHATVPHATVAHATVAHATVVHSILRNGSRGRQQDGRRVAKSAVGVIVVLLI